MMGYGLRTMESGVRKKKRRSAEVTPTGSRRRESGREIVLPKQTARSGEEERMRGLSLSATSVLGVYLDPVRGDLRATVFFFF